MFAVTVVCSNLKIRVVSSRHLWDNLLIIGKLSHFCFFAGTKLEQIWKSKEYHMTGLSNIKRQYIQKEEKRRTCIGMYLTLKVFWTVVLS